jgi:hypothetical protein
MERFNDIGPVLLAVFAIGFIVFVAMRLKAKSHVTIPVEEQERIAFEAAPKCVCGEVATHPTPRLQRSRGSWIRKFFAAPPSYRREVDPMARPALCEPHAHVADSLMDRFIFGVRQEHATLNAKIAQDAAGFEQEALLNMLRESLTDKQKRAQRLPVPISIRALPKNGTDDSASS